MADEGDYVLGTDDEELRRLGLQHAIWQPRMRQAWDHAGIGAGARVIDVGAGPGYATHDLAQRVGPAGRVLAVERSARYVAFGREQCLKLGLPQVEFVEQDVTQPLPVTGFDAAWCRWVACFVSSPEALVANVGAALKKRGVAVFHEYADYASWRMAPRRPLQEEFVRNVMASWRDAGGEPDIALALPALLAKHGFAIRRLEPVVWILSPQDPAWRWLASYMETGPQRLLELGRVDAGWIRRLHAELRDAERDPATRMMSPMVWEIVAERA